MKLTLNSTEELSKVEVLLIENIYYMLNEIDKIKENIIRCATDEDIHKIHEYTQKLSAIISLGLLNQLKEQFWKETHPTTLRKIVNQEKFISKSTWSESFLIDQRVIRNFGSYDLVSNDEKGQLAKKLGAKIVI